MVPENIWHALQALDDAFPQELAKMAKFVCERYRPHQWEAKERIVKACSLLGNRGEMILVDCGL